MDADYLGLTRKDDGTERGQELKELEDQEAAAEKALASEQAAIDMQEKFLAKKRRRIELLQTQTKQVTLSNLSLTQFSDLLMRGKTPAPGAGAAPTASIPSKLLLE